MYFCYSIYLDSVENPKQFIECLETCGIATVLWKMQNVKRRYQRMRSQWERPYYVFLKS